VTCAPASQDLTIVIALVALLAGIIIGTKVPRSSDPPS
jgi:uncharacterized protein YneF (UPF0154 family)